MFDFYLVISSEALKLIVNISISRDFNKKTYVVISSDK